MSNQLFNPFDMLFNPVFLTFAVTAFVILSIVSWMNRKKLSKKYIVLFVLILAILMVYFMFIIWAIIGFGSNHGPRP